MSNQLLENKGLSLSKYFKIHHNSELSGDIKEFLLAYYQKYPNSKLKLVEKSFCFGHHYINEKFIFYKVKFCGKFSKYISDCGIEKVVVDLGNKIIRTIEIDLDKNFKIKEKSSIDLIVYHFKQNKKIIANKYLHTLEELGYFKKKILNKGREIGDEVMTDIMQKVRREYTLTID